MKRLRTPNLAPIENTIRNMMKSRNLMIITLTQSLFMLTASLWWPYWSLHILELGVSKTLLGMIFMAETVAQLIFQIPGGVLTRARLGRKKMIVLGSIFRATSPLIYVVTGSWQFVLMGMFITQMSNMMVPAIDALIAESTNVEHRAMGYGTFRMMTLLPMIFTPFIGGVITDRLGVYGGVRVAITATFIVAWFNVLIRRKFLEDTYDSGEHASSRLDALKEIRNVPKPIWTLIVVAAFASIGLRVANQFMAVYATQIIVLTNTQWGLIMTSVGIVSTLLTIPSSIWSDRVGRKPGIMVSLGLTPLMYAGFPLSGGLIQLAASRILGAISEGFGGAVTGLEGGSAWLALVADIVPAKQRGKVMGLIATVAGVLSFPGAWIGGLLWDNIGPQIPFYVAAGTSSVAFLIFTFFVKEPKTKAE